MGRAGSGGSGGGFSSGGGHNMNNRSSGGHRPGGSSGSRAGSSSRSSTPGYSRGTTNNYYYGSHPRTYHRSTMTTGAAVVICIFILILLFFVHGVSSAGSVPASTQNREKLTGTSFSNECVIDEINWVENSDSLSKNLKYFFDKTGVQPFIYLRAYDPGLTTDAQKESYAKDWYDANINNEHTFLMMYFAEKNVDTDVGYMCYVNGKQVSSVMDAEAVSIYWAYIDKYWYSNMSTVDMFTNVYKDTADRVMVRTTTAADVGMTIAIIVLVVVVIVGIIIFICLKRKHDKERAQETAAILNADIDTLSDRETDDTLNKYFKG